MKIVVCIKQVPDTNEVKLDPKTNRLIRDGVPSIIPKDLFERVQMRVEKNKRIPARTKS